MLTFPFLEHLLHIGGLSLQVLHMFPLFVLKLAQLAGEAGTGARKALPAQ